MLADHFGQHAKKKTHTDGDSDVADVARPMQSKPPPVDPSALVQEWKDCSAMMHSDESVELADFCQLLLSTPHYAEQYANLSKLATVALIIPVTSVECEFSSQNHIKTKLRGKLFSATHRTLD